MQVNGLKKIGLIVVCLSCPAALMAGQKEAHCGSWAFSHPETLVKEARGKVKVLISRIGGSKGVVSVGVYSTVLGTALGGIVGNKIDFKHVGTKLIWAAGDNTDKALEILIIDDKQVEHTENFWLKLRYASGGATVGKQASHLVKIVDDD